MSNFWRVIGVGLLIWVAWDLYFGYTVLYDVIYKDQEPTLYWVSVTIWLGLGLSCFYTQKE